MCLPLRAAGWQMGFSTDKRELRPLARERRGWDSADPPKNHFLKVPLEHTAPKTAGGVLRAKSLGELSFYCRIIHQLGKEVFFLPQSFPAPAHAHSLVLLPIGVVLKDIFQGLVIKADILLGNRDFLKTGVPNLNPLMADVFLKGKPVLLRCWQDKLSLDLCSLLLQSPFQMWEGIMTVQFVARFSLSFLWYFQKNVTEPDGPPSPANSQS